MALHALPPFGVHVAAPANDRRQAAALKPWSRVRPMHSGRRHSKLCRDDFLLGRILMQLWREFAGQAANRRDLVRGSIRVPV